MMLQAHRHRFGVEIHLSFEPLEGYMIFGEYKVPVTPSTRCPSRR